ncbi:hypothetical protein Mgra_00005043 [Meloidogyne graminicola]|uniref:Uncharacterized protein n=1 Tax=Meloidogyne graminicola TaxID=189291 RepID=A0A8S9ZPX2_9BILA|nr:hypothetical protein Mgra_00005043 [Meloidogyne graminicola]
MFSLIYSEMFAVICAVVSIISFSSLFFCCKSKKKDKGYTQRQDLKSKMKSGDKPSRRDKSESAELPSTMGKQKKHMKVEKTQITASDGAIKGIKTAKVFTPRVAATKPTTTAASVKQLPGSSNKSKKAFKTASEAGVAVPADENTAPDTARLDLSDSWKETSKMKYKLPEEMTRRRLDDPNYQTWRGLENVFGSSKKKGGDDISPESKSRVDNSKSNLSSKSSVEPNSSMMEEKEKAKQAARSEGDTKEVTLKSEGSTTDNKGTKGDKQNNNTKSGHDDDNEGKVDED